jgi:non-heme chloroperoxidase
MREHRIKGGGGVELFVSDQGDKDAPAFVLIHGWAQSHICWRKQAALAEDYRLVALDLRGHGASDKPEDATAYADNALWGEDIASVIKALDLKAPILVGWSYGSRVIASYLDTYGDDAIAGVVVAGGILTTGKVREDWMLGASSPGLNRDLYDTDDSLRAAATTEFVRACTLEPLDDDLTNALIKDNMRVTALVRRALFSASWDFRPVFQALKKPLLAIHGVEDEVVTPMCGITASELAQNGDLALYENTGHAPFLEQPERFNADLTEFATTAFGAAP